MLKWAWKVVVFSKVYVFEDARSTGVVKFNVSGTVLLFTAFEAFSGFSLTIFMR